MEALNRCVSQGLPVCAPSVYYNDLQGLRAEQLQEVECLRDCFAFVECLQEMRQLLSQHRQPGTRVFVLGRRGGGAVPADMRG